MLDTNTVSHIVKGRSRNARRKLAELKADDIVCISAITEAEILYGLAKNPDAARLTPPIEAFLSKIQVLAWGRKEAAAYGRVRAEQERLGKTIGNLDLLIAAHAVAIGAVLVSADTVFQHVKSLPGIANWADDLSAKA